MNLLHLVQQARQLAIKGSAAPPASSPTPEPAPQAVPDPAPQFAQPVDICARPASGRPYVHLHAHTAEGSPGDALCSADQLAAQAKELGQPAIAITDHGSVSGWWKFDSACKQQGVKPLFGCEFYLAEGDKADRRDTIAGKHAYHLTLIAENNAGRDNIIRLNNIAHRDGFYHRPRVDIDDLRGNASGIICLSGCVSGVIAQAYLSGRANLAEEWAVRLADTIGRKNFYLEVQGHSLPQQQEVNGELFPLARRLGLPVVATGDVHYAKAADSETHDTLICVARNQRATEGRDKRYPAGQFYVRSGDEMAGLFSGRPDVINNTLAIAERCNVDLNLGLSLMPGFELPGGKSAEVYLRDLAAAALNRAGLDSRGAYAERLRHELSTIISLGFAPYFLLVAELVGWAKAQGIEVGPGRGSAVGSLVAYLMGITALDPIEHGLLFERFLMPDRVSLPDIDLDFEKERREEVVQHLAGRYHVLPILTRNYLQAKASIRDAGRAMAVPLATVDRLASKVDGDDGLSDIGKEAFAEFLSKNTSDDSTDGRWFREAVGLYDSVRTLGKHASGLLLLEKKIDVSLIPVQRTHKELVAAWDMDDVEAVKGLKLDVLGLGALTVLKKVRQFDAVKESRQDELWRDRSGDVFDMLSTGKTTGIFQLESRGMQALLRSIRPRIFDDITAAISLFRPGSLQSGQADLFVQARSGVPIDHADARVNEVLRDTAGVVVYQEQVMKLAKVVGGFNDSEADALRRVVAKKEPEKMKPLMDKFVAGAVQNGFCETDARDLASTIARFGGYGFNKSHAVAYAHLSHQMAFYKTVFPAQFWAARLSVEPGGADAQKRFEDYIRAAQNDGIRMLPPDINRSLADFCVEDGQVRFGLTGVKGVGPETAVEVVRERETNGQFSDLKALYQRLVGAKVCGVSLIVSLARCGGLDGFGASRTQIVDELQHLHRHRNRKSPPPPLAHSAGRDGAWDRIVAEYDLLGAPLATGLGAVFPAEALLNFDRLETGVPSVIGGRIGRIDERRTRNDKPYLRLTLEGPKDKMLVMVFSDCLDGLVDSPSLKEGDFLTVRGTFDDHYHTFKADAMELARN